MPNDIENQIRRGQYEELYRSRVSSNTADPRTMNSPDIIREIKALRETMNLAAQRLVVLSQSLHTHARRNASTDSATTAYLSFAAAWGRFGGAIQQGLRRTQVADRVLDQALGAQQEEQRAFEAREARRQQQADREAEKRRVKPDRPNPIRNANPLRTLEGDSLEDLMNLYGVEVLRDAAR